MKGSESNRELDERSTKVNKQLHRIGLIISIMMFVVTLVLLIVSITKVYAINKDFTSGNVRGAFFQGQYPHHTLCSHHADAALSAAYDFPVGRRGFL